MRVDPRIVEQYFIGNLNRGRILRFKMECDDPRRQFRHKFGVVLNRDCSESEVLLAITTTKVEKFTGGFFEADIIRINTGIYECFPEPTVINLRQIRTEPIAKLRALCSVQDMTFEECLNEAHVAELDAKLGASRLIEIAIKRRIV